MKTVTTGMVVLLALALAGTASAGKDKEESQLRLELDLVDGSRVIGAPGIDSVPLQTPYATMDVPLNQIRTITMGDDHETASFDLRNGDKLKGVVNLKPIKLETVFGRVAVGIEHVKVAHVILLGKTLQEALKRGLVLTARVNNLVLWNTLGSQYDVEHSVVGPNGDFLGGNFVPGKSGTAIRYTPPAGQVWGPCVTFPKEVIPTHAGTIEFWAKLTGFGDTLQWNQNPSFLFISDGTNAMDLHLNGNDGNSNASLANSGLCGDYPAGGHIGTKPYTYTWTYDALLGGSGQGDQWHHYAFVWDENGIPGVGHRIAAYVDGVLNTQRWANDTGMPFVPFASGRLGLIPWQGRTAGTVLMENIKIWDYAMSFEPK